MRAWRTATWALAIWNVLMILWFVRVSSELNNLSCAGESEFGLTMCEWGASIGLNYGVSLVILVWLIGFIALGLIWLIDRPRASIPR